MHWKFYLSLLRLEFLRDDGSMCIPLNLIPTPRAFYDCFTRFRGGDYRKRDGGIKDEAVEEDEEENEEFEDVLPGKSLRPHFTVRPTNIHKPVRYVLRIVYAAMLFLNLLLDTIIPINFSSLL